MVEGLKLASSKGDQLPYRSNTASHMGPLFWPMWPAAVDRTLLLDERSLSDEA